MKQLIHKLLMRINKMMGCYDESMEEPEMLEDTIKLKRKATRRDVEVMTPKQQVEFIENLNNKLSRYK